MLKPYSTTPTADKFYVRHTDTKTRLVNHWHAYLSREQFKEVNEASMKLFK
jgi:hypothetical protein